MSLWARMARTDLPINEDGVVLFGFQDDGRVAGYWADPEHPVVVPTGQGH